MGIGSVRKTAPLPPIFVAGLDVGDTQIKEVVNPVQVQRRLKKYLWLIGSWATAVIENDARVRRLDVAGIGQLVLLC